jgi:hypothetical protein
VKAGIAAASAALLLIACSQKAEEKPSPALNAAAAAVKARQAECAAARPALIAKYQDHLRNTEFSAAEDAFGDCSTFSDAADLRAMKSEAVKARLRAAGLNSKLPAAERLAALRSLGTQFPEEATTHASVLATLEQTVEKQRVAEAKRAEAEDLKRRKREGVTLGMSQDDVLKSSWGRPERINRTHNKYGTHEQWVYPGGYLYFEDGTLTSIQN